MSDPHRGVRRATSVAWDLDVTADFVATYMSEAYELVDAYDNFWKQFAKLASRPVQPSALKIRPSNEVEGESLRLEIGRDEALGVLGVSSGGVRDAERFDVFVSGMQIVRKAKGECEGEYVWLAVRSEFEVLYLNALEKKDAKNAWDARNGVFSRLGDGRSPRS